MLPLYVDISNTYSSFVSEKLKKYFKIVPTSDVGIYFSSSNLNNPKKIKILILEHGNFVFDDVDRMLKTDWDLVISPRMFDVTTKKFILTSFYEQYVIENLEVNKNLKLSDKIIYCSQPLKEDKRNIGYDQIQLENFIETILKKNNIKKSLLVRIHPREERASGVIYSNALESLLNKHDTWIGHSSMILYAAREIGRNSIILENKFVLDEKMENFIVDKLETYESLDKRYNSKMNEIINLISKLIVEDHEY